MIKLFFIVTALSLYCVKNWTHLLYMLAHAKGIFNFVCAPLILGLSSGLFTWVFVMVHKCLGQRVSAFAVYWAACRQPELMSPSFL